MVENKRKIRQRNSKTGELNYTFKWKAREEVKYDKRKSKRSKYV
jgi:hypothetical protein